MVATTKGFKLLLQYWNFVRLFTREFTLLNSLVNSIEFISELYIESTVLNKRKQKILQWTLYTCRVYKKKRNLGISQEIHLVLKHKIFSPPGI